MNMPATVVTGHGVKEYLFIDATYGVEILMKVATEADGLALKALINAATAADKIAV